MLARGLWLGMLGLVERCVVGECGERAVPLGFPLGFLLRCCCDYCDCYSPRKRKDRDGHHWKRARVPSTEVCLCSGS